VLCRLSDRRQAAIGYYTQALSLDPFFWSAYEDLCLLGMYFYAVMSSPSITSDISLPFLLSIVLFGSLVRPGTQRKGQYGLET
jgi:hypothetical protein